MCTAHRLREAALGATLQPCPADQMETIVPNLSESAPRAPNARRCAGGKLNP